MPVPPVYLRMSQSAQKDRVVREVIDGQQRISAVIDFLRDEYALSGVSNVAWKGKRFSQLTEEERRRVRDYSFSAEIFSSLSDAEVLEIFSRLNTYSVRLNDQELRNGKYFGQFKQDVYRLALEHLEFWRVHGIFTERSIARMEEAELVSELIVAGLDGLQDKKNSLDQFYAKYDDNFPGREEAIARFKAVLAQIADASPAPLKETEFNRRPLFYSLYTAVYHRMYGLPNETAARPRKGPLIVKEKEKLVSTIVMLSEAIDNARNDGVISDAAAAEFVAASLRQTDNIQPRQTRLDVIYRGAFL